MYESKISELQEALKKLEASNAEIESAFGIEFVDPQTLEDAKRIKREISALESEQKKITSAQEAIADLLGKFLFFNNEEKCWRTERKPVRPNIEDSLSFYTEIEENGDYFNLRGSYYIDDDLHTRRTCAVATVSLKEVGEVQVWKYNVADLIDKIYEDNAETAAFRAAELKWVLAKLTSIIENTAREFSGRKIIVS